MSRKRNRTTADKGNVGRINARIRATVFKELLDAREVTDESVPLARMDRFQLNELARIATRAVVMDAGLNVVLKKIKTVMEQEKNGTI